MSLLMLTTPARMLRYLGSINGEILTDNVSANRDIQRWIPSVSAMVEQYLNRGLYLEARTEYFDITYNRKEYFPIAHPISILTSVHEDSSGLFNGNEAEITDCWLGMNNRSVNLPLRIISYEKPRALRIIYTGGMATSGCVSVYAITPTGSWTVGKFVLGQISGAVGIVRTVGTASSSLSVEILYGMFQTGETLTMQDDEQVTGSATATAVLTAKTTPALVESYPDIVAAAEMQIRYNYTYRMSFENTSTSKDGQTQKRPSTLNSYILQPEAQVLLDPYARLAV